MTGWQDIATAPRDGTEILACWDAPTPEFKARGVVMWDVSYGGTWITLPGHWPKHPTHWMPLPEPPEAE